MVPEAREDELIRYRTINNQGVEVSRNLRDTIVTMRNRQDWARDEMIAQGFGENLLVGSVPSHATADELASHIRGGLSLAAGVGIKAMPNGSASCVASLLMRVLW